MNTETATPKTEQQTTTDAPKADKTNFKQRSFAELQQLFLEVVTDDDVKKVARKLVDIAVEGDFPAIKLFLSYTLGKPEAMWASLESAAFNSKVKRSASKPTSGFSSSSSLPPLTGPGVSDASNISLVNNRRSEKHKRR